MGTVASQITSFTIVYSTVYSGADQRKQSSASLAFVRRIHRWPVNSPHKWPVTLGMFPFDDVIMAWQKECIEIDLMVGNTVYLIHHQVAWRIGRDLIGNVRNHQIIVSWRLHKNLYNNSEWSCALCLKLRWDWRQYSRVSVGSLR